MNLNFCNLLDNTKQESIRPSLFIYNIDNLHIMNYDLDPTNGLRHLGHNVIYQTSFSCNNFKNCKNSLSCIKYKSKKELIYSKHK